MKKLMVVVSLFVGLAGCSMSSTQPKSSSPSQQVESLSLQKEFKPSEVALPKERFNRKKQKTYAAFYDYLENQYGHPQDTVEKETADGNYLKTDYFLDDVTGTQYFVGQNTLAEHDDLIYTYFGILAYSQEALDIALQTTDYYTYKEDILASNPHRPFYVDGVGLSYRTIPVTETETAYGISIFSEKEYLAYNEVVYTETE